MTSERRWRKRLTVGAETFEVEFCQRPFREGLEVTTIVDGQPVRLAELGLGEQAAIQRLSAEIARIRDKPSNS